MIDSGRLLVGETGSRGSHARLRLPLPDRGLVWDRRTGLAEGQR